MTQIERIESMEQIFCEAQDAIRALSGALERYRALREKIEALEVYYTGPLWMSDYQDDCEGKLPQGLRRGVLSEDALYDLLGERDRLREMIRTL